MLEDMFKRLALKKVHDDVPAPSLHDVVIDAGQVRMLEAGEQLRLVCEGVNGPSAFLRTQTALTHLLDGGQARIEVQVFCLIDGREAASSNLRQDTVALFEELMLLQEAG